MARLNAKNLLGVSYALSTDLLKLIDGSSTAAFDAATGVITLKLKDGSDYTISLANLVQVVANNGLSVSNNKISLSIDNGTDGTLEFELAEGTNGKLKIASAVMARITALEGKFGTLTANKVAKINSTGTAVESAGYAYDDVVTNTTDTSVAAGNIVVGTGTGLEVKDSSVALSNVVTNTAGAATAADKILVSGGADKSAKSSEMGILKQGSSTSSVITADDTTVPSTKAVKTAIDEISSQAIGVAEGKGIDITTSGTTKTINADLRIVKLATPTTGFAASYKLQYLKAGGTPGTAADYVDYDNGSATIDILKDKFLKEAKFGWGSGSDPSASGFSWQETKDATHTYPFIRFIVYVRDDAGTGTETETFYVDVKSLFHEYTGDGVINVDNSSGVISLKGDWLFDGKVVETLENGSIAASTTNTADLVTETNNATGSDHIMVSGGANKSVKDSAKTIASSTTAVSNDSSSVPLSAAVYTELAAKATTAALNTEIAAASAAEQVLWGNDTNINNALGNVFNVTSQDVTLQSGTYGIFTAVVSGGKVTITGAAGSVAGANRVVAVYTQTGEQLYLDVKYVSSTKVATVEADYGTAAQLEASGDTAYTIVYTVPATKATITQPTDR